MGLPETRARDLHPRVTVLRGWGRLHDQLDGLGGGAHMAVSAPARLVEQFGYRPGRDRVAAFAYCEA